MEVLIDKIQKREQNSRFWYSFWDDYDKFWKTYL